jgi:hypothetical protein
MTLQLRNSKTVSGRWLFNPAVMPSKNCASNLQSTKSFRNPPIRAAFHLHPLGEPQSNQISSPLSPRSPQVTCDEQIQKWRRRDQARRMGRRRSRSRRLGSGLKVSAPTMTSKDLFPRDCSKTRVLSTGAPLFANLSPWKI